MAADVATQSQILLTVFVTFSEVTFFLPAASAPPRTSLRTRGKTIDLIAADCRPNSDR